MIFNPWTTRFEHCWTDEEIDRVVAVPASPVSLEGRPANAGAEILRGVLGKIFFPTAQTRGKLRLMNDIAYSHARSHFLSEEVYMYGLYEPNPWGEHVSPAVCVTGLAGIGKSALIRAFRTLIGPDTLIDVGDHKNIPLVSGWILTLRDGTEMNQLLRPCVMPDFPQPDLVDFPVSVKRLSVPELLSLARRRSWRDGVCWLAIDEFQHITLGSETNAKAASVLLKFLGVGPQVVYVANFSLLHRLKKRGQEDRDRFLHMPIVVYPEARSSPDFIGMLVEYTKAAPETLSFDVNSTQELIHECTFGIPRSIICLLIVATRDRLARGKRARMDDDDLVRAYRSAEYAACREDVEDLLRQQITGKIVRRDLWCPFSGLDDIASFTSAKKAVEGFRQRVEEDYLRSSLTAAEAEALRSIENKHSEESPPDRVVPLKKPKITRESLLEGSEKFDKLHH
ncbi:MULTISPECIES: ATP-binding protein [Paraburkholderia]|uniref:ATP-binding protein n=1 Tax=Paraburkholderia TaxID=1822464 RepID=UPI002256D798|nr:MULTISPECIES: ATP-binding protein [Paraburkholderia]MCX4162772.1 ATP-binding protein [Paraburkholderia megapolitana]MDN7158267.1 ATP-binding protein [Paraburkholderia sp. CHISQ3]MDQ6495314.1 ATP-binding protein [Paraburkholderia megapolitana]